MPDTTVSLPDRARILVVRTDRLGDVLLTLPVVSLLRERFPRAHLAMLLARYTGEIVRTVPLLDELLWVDDERGAVGFFRLVREIRRNRFDAVLIVRPELRVALAAFLAGIPVRIGTAYRLYSVLFTHRVHEHRKTAEKHEVEYNAALLRPLGIDPETAAFTFPVSVEESERRAVEARLRGMGVPDSRQRIILHPGSGGSAREWPARHFAELGRRLQKRGFQVLVTGIDSERALTGEVARGSGPPARDLSGQLSLRELAALIAGSRMLVANSTGPLHLAAALGVPVIGFYPQTPPMTARRWGPYTEKAEVLEAPRLDACPVCSGTGSGECLCMASVSVERAMSAADRLLGHPSSAPPRSMTHA